MKRKLTLCTLMVAGLMGGSARAEQGAVVVGTPADKDGSAVVLNSGPTKEGSAVTIEKGKLPQWTEYEIVDGNDDIYGTPEYDRTKAYAAWKTACTEWKQSMKELNSERQLITLNCMSPKFTTDAGLITYRSSGTYKMRVKIRERK